MRNVKIKVARDGSRTEITVEGVKGQSCEDLTKGLVEALGSVEASEKTPEYYQEDLSVLSVNS